MTTAACPIPSGFDKAVVTAASVTLKMITATAPDATGGTYIENGLGPVDGSFSLCDLFNYPTLAGRSDLNCSGVVDPADRSVLLDYILNDVTSLTYQPTTYCQ